MILRDSIGLSVSALLQHRLRTALSVLGIAIGVAALIIERAMSWRFRRRPHATVAAIAERWTEASASSMRLRSAGITAGPPSVPRAVAAAARTSESESLE